jgi:hypothetical protein
MRMPGSSPEAHNFWSSFVDDLEMIRKELSSRFQTIGALPGANLVQTVERGEVLDSTSEQFLRLSTRTPAVGDTVAFLPMADGSGVVLGAFAGSGIEPEAAYYRPSANSGAGADVASNTSTSVYASFLGVTFANLPAGTYTMSIEASAVFSHSVAGGQLGLHTIAVGSNTVTGSVKIMSIAPVANAEMRLNIANDLTGITVAEGGTITGNGEYRCSTAGTVSARNGSVNAILVRTGN